MKSLRLPRSSCLVLLLLPACSWDFSKLSVADFNKHMCEVADNFKKNATDSASRITDPARRDQAFVDLNQKLAQLAQAKLRAYNAYVNCNEAELKAAQALAESIIGAVGQALSANFSQPVRQVAFQMQGSKPAGLGTQSWQMGSGAVTFLAGTTPTLPLQASGVMQVDLQSTPTGLLGALRDLQWRVQIAGIAAWAVRARPGTGNRITLTRGPNGDFSGDLHAALLVDGPGVTWPVVVDLPIVVDATQTQWTCDSAGMQPASRFFPIAPQANNRFGHGCAGGLSGEPSLDVISVPRVGDPLVVQVSGGPSNAFGGLVIGFSRGQFDLTSVFGPGCTLLVQPDLTLLFPMPLGLGHQVLPIPPEPSLAGLRLEMQALVLESRGGSFGGGLTGGATEVVVPR